MAWEHLIRYRAGEGRSTSGSRRRLTCIESLELRRLLSGNLVTNGDFSLGNTGFTTDYGYGSIGGDGFCLVGDNPHNHHGGGADFPDHTTGTGLMLLANGHATAGKAVWSQTISVTAGASYVFSGWAASWGGGGKDSYPASLVVEINGVAVGEALQLPSTGGQWVQWTIEWNSGSATTATIRIVDAQTNWYGNDFAIDDLSFGGPQTPGHVPTALTLQPTSIPENQPVGTPIGSFTTTDPDPGDTFTYTLVSGAGDADNASFAMVGDSLRAAAVFDYEVKNTYAIRVRTTDQTGRWLEATFTIAVTDAGDLFPLTIVGTPNADTISVAANLTHYIVTLNGDVSYTPVNSVSQIDIRGDAGDDTITVDYAILCPTSILGQGGNDTILAGSGNDTIYGGDGNDSVYGNAGDDSLHGNFGDDSLYGGVGLDSLMGGLGLDYLVGGANNDSLYGGDGQDTLYGNSGHDYIEGKGKADEIHGGEGNDTLLGRAGADLLYGDGGDDSFDTRDDYILAGIPGAFPDTIYGGEGSDSLLHDSSDTWSEIETLLS